MVPSIKLLLKNITCLQFAIIESSYIEDVKVKLQYGAKFEKVNEKNLVILYTHVNFANETPFLLHEISTSFSINKEAWDLYYKTEDDSLVLPFDLANHLVGIGISTLRGSLNAKTEGTKFNKFLLPLINSVTIVKEVDGKCIITTNAELLDTTA